MNDEFNKLLIGGHEGLRLVPYRDSRGILTVGKGFNLEAPGAAELCARLHIAYAAVVRGMAITPAQAEAIFDAQYQVAADQARIVMPGIATYPENAAAVICDMIFQLGLLGFLKFRNAIAAFRAQDWKKAAAEIQDSELAKQTPHRVEENIALLEAIE